MSPEIAEPEKLAAHSLKRPASGRLAPSSSSPRDAVSDLQRTIGNQAVVDLLGAKSESASHSGEPPRPSGVASPELVAQPFAVGRPLYLKQGQQALTATVQRRLGNKGDKGDYVFNEPDAKTSKRGQIENVAYQEGLFSRTLRGRKKVKSYLIDPAPQANEHKPIIVSPDDRDWFMTEGGRAKGAVDEQEQETESEAEVDTKEDGGSVTQGLLGDRSATATAKGVVTKGKAIAGAGAALGAAGKGMVSKVDYYKTNADTVLTVLDKGTSYLNTASHAFPPAKVVTEPLRRVTQLIGAARTAQLGNKMRKDKAAVPLIAPTAFADARDKLQALLDNPKFQKQSDEGPGQVERMIDALDAAEKWFGAQLSESESKEDEGETPPSDE